LRARHRRDVPDFDPRDGGSGARLLLLLETPGPRIGHAAGVVSRDNPTGTARNLRRFLDDAGIARADTVIWNAVPWVIHEPGARNRAPRAEEVRVGLAALPPLLDLLPRLRVAVLAGRVAGQARGILEAARPGLPVLAMPHPSPTFVCTSPAVPARIAAALAAARAVLDEPGQPASPEPRKPTT
jgi:uracil-DNA glycosylase